MTTHPSSRGRHLLTADRRFSTGGGLLSRIAGTGAKRLLDRIDAGLERGSIKLRLPDGSERLLGGRAAGPDAPGVMPSWRAVVRLAVRGERAAVRSGTRG